MTGLLAATVDPAPITAWLGLVLACMGVIGGVVASIAALWRWVAEPRLTRAATDIIAQHAAQHAAEHASLNERIEAAETAASISVARIHDRIDAVHQRIDRIARPT